MTWASFAPPWLSECLPGVRTCEFVCHMVNKLLGFALAAWKKLKIFSQIPNGGLMVIYHGRKEQITLDKQKIDESSNRWNGDEGICDICHSMVCRIA